MKLRKNKLHPLRFELNGACAPTGVLPASMSVAAGDPPWAASSTDRAEWTELVGRLRAIRDTMLEPEGQPRSDASGACAKAVSASDTSFVRWPERALKTYLAQRQASELGKLFRAANRFQALVDRVVVIGSFAETIGARAILDACCQPYWNELSRGDRGSKPRMYFAGDQLDNDAMQSLLYLLGAHRGQEVHAEDDRWGICVINKSGTALEAEIALQQFLPALRTSLGASPSQLSECILTVTAGGSRLESQVMELGRTEVFSITDDAGPYFSALTFAGLLPAALVGINVIELLEGASWMTRHFADTPPEHNMVLQWVAVNHWLQSRSGFDVRVVDVGNAALETCGQWCCHLMATNLSELGHGCVPMTTVHTRDIAGIGKSRLHGRPNQLVHQWSVDEVRFDALPIEHGACGVAETSVGAPFEPRGLEANARAPGIDAADSRVDASAHPVDGTLPQASARAMQTAYRGLQRAGRPATRLHLPRADELHLGQLFQMMMLATWVESRLLLDASEALGNDADRSH